MIVLTLPGQLRSILQQQKYWRPLIGRFEQGAMRQLLG